MRESFRLNKNILLNEEPTFVGSLDVVFMFTGPGSSLRHKRSFENVSESMRRMMEAIAEEE